MRVWFFGLLLLLTPSPYLSRQVDSADGEKLAQVNDCAWIETSAKNGTNISAFILLGIYYTFLN